MNKFKVGDKVRRVCSSHGGMYPGAEDVVAEVSDPRIVALENYGRGHDSHSLELVEDKSKWHKHHDLITAWAKGAQMEYYSKFHNTWEAVSKNEPSWYANVEYRIKPESPKSDEDRIAELEARVKELEKNCDP